MNPVVDVSTREKRDLNPGCDCQARIGGGCPGRRSSKLKAGAGATILQACCYLVSASEEEHFVFTASTKFCITLAISTQFHQLHGSSTASAETTPIHQPFRHRVGEK